MESKRTSVGVARVHANQFNSFVRKGAYAQCFHFSFSCLSYLLGSICSHYCIWIGRKVVMIGIFVVLWKVIRQLVSWRKGVTLKVKFIWRLKNVCVTACVSVDRTQLTQTIMNRNWLSKESNYKVNLHRTTLNPSNLNRLCVTFEKKAF